MSSNAGGKSYGGSGTRPAFGGGVYYGGGARVPYTSGQTSPSGAHGMIIVPGVFTPVDPPAAEPDGQAYYCYNLGPWTYFNRTTEQNVTRPVTCVCRQYRECGCDDNGDQGYRDQVANNDTLALGVVTINNTQTLVLNGTLANGTTASTSLWDSLTPDAQAGFIIVVIAAFFVAAFVIYCVAGCCCCCW